jgi:hydroxyethylthiazole kinase-like uncharacterized protein yjeF
MITPILRSAALRAVEARHADADPPLMERAGAALAAEIERMLPDADAPLLIVAGPGNNGGDALVAARLLKEEGVAPVVVLAGDPERLPGDARAALEAWLTIGGKILPDVPERDWSLAVDGLFGIGLTRPVEGRAAELIECINRLGCPVLAVDLPSGLCADTGRVLGVAVGASRTLTFIAGKPGLYTRDGPDHCGGEVVVDTLGLVIDDPEGRLIAPELFWPCLLPRRRNCHKGSFGSVGIVGGAAGMAGAALLAGRASLGLGAGRVYVGLLETLPVDPLQPELMLRAADEVFGLATTLAVGPGLGRSDRALALLRQAIDAPLPLVLDADALNLLADHPVLFAKVSRRAAPTVLTPHPAEAARLLAANTETVQADRVASAVALAQRSRALVALKGCGTVIARSDGRWWLNASGNAGLATAGSGDVLTGLIAALLAQAWPAETAVATGVHLHGRAADDLVAAGIGPIGLTAGEIVGAARERLNRWIADGAFAGKARMASKGG